MADDKFMTVREDMKVEKTIDVPAISVDETVSTAEPLRNERLATTAGALGRVIEIIPPELCLIMADYRELLGTFSSTCYV
jgi:hypothetical protein